MIKQVFFFTGLFLLAFTGLCQTNDVLSTTILRKGVYRSFEEFRTNSPSLTGEFYMKEKTEAAQIINGSTQNKLYKLESNGKTTRIKKNVWGYCDGNNVFIFWSSNSGMKKYFLKIQFIDRYCLFKDSGYTYAPMTNIPIPYEKDYVINVNNGGVFPLRENIVKTILKKDSKMLKEFNNEIDKSSVRREYIKRYCLKYPDEVKAVEETP